MSIRMIAEVWRRQISGGKQAVCLVLADFANDAGLQVRPSIAMISWKTGLSERQVTRIMGELRQAGALQVIAHGQGGRGQVPEYQLMLDKLRLKPGTAKGKKSQPITVGHKKGDMVSPFEEQKGDIASPFNAQKGDIRSSPVRKINGMYDSLGDDMNKTSSANAKSQSYPRTAARAEIEEIEKNFSEALVLTGSVARFDAKLARQLLERYDLRTITLGIWLTAARAREPIHSLAYCQGAIAEAAKNGLTDSYAVALASYRRHAEKKKRHLEQGGSIGAGGVIMAETHGNSP